MMFRDRRHLRAVVAIVAAMAVAGACSKKKAEKEDAGETAAPVEDAPPIVVAMTDAHGGMVGWRTAQSISFTVEMAGGASDSTVAVYETTVDPANGRMVVDVAGTEQRMGWDGTRVWSLNWNQPYASGFLAEMNYYLLNLPFLAMDPDAKLAVSAPDTLWGDSTAYRVVKMTPASRRGVRPGSYRLYIDPDSKHLRACTFAAAPAGGASQQLLLRFEEYARTDGMLLPSKLTMYAGDYTPVVVATFRDWKLDRPFDASRAAMPDSAVTE